MNKIYTVILNLGRQFLTQLGELLLDEDIEFEDIDFQEVGDLLAEYGNLRSEIARSAKQGFQGTRASIDALGVADYLEQWEELPTILRTIARMIEDDINNYGELADKYIED